MKSAGVPVVPGSDGVIATYEDAIVEAKRIGYPLMIKASLEAVEKVLGLLQIEDELENAFITAKMKQKIILVMILYIWRNS